MPRRSPRKGRICHAAILAELIAKRLQTGKISIRPAPSGIALAGGRLSAVVVLFTGATALAASADITAEMGGPASYRSFGCRSRG